MSPFTAFYANQFYLLKYFLPHHAVHLPYSVHRMSVTKFPPMLLQSLPRFSFISLIFSIRSLIESMLALILGMISSAFALFSTISFSSNRTIHVSHLQLLQIHVQPLQPLPPLWKHSGKEDLSALLWKKYPHCLLYKY